MPNPERPNRTPPGFRLRLAWLARPPHRPTAPKSFAARRTTHTHTYPKTPKHPTSTAVPCLEGVDCGVGVCINLFLGCRFCFLLVLGWDWDLDGVLSGCNATLHGQSVVLGFRFFPPWVMLQRFVAAQGLERSIRLGPSDGLRCIFCLFLGLIPRHFLGTCFFFCALDRDGI